MEHRPEDLRKQTILVSEEREFQENEIASTETQLGACWVRVGAGRGLRWPKSVCQERMVMKAKR